MSLYYTDGMRGKSSTLKSASFLRWLRGAGILLALIVLVSGYQNCSWSGSDSNFKGAQYQLQASSGNGESYDGKPEPDYIRRVPGYSCGGSASEYGSLNIMGDQTLLAIMDGEQCLEEKEIRTSDLFRSPNTDAVIGYQDGIYTKSESDLMTSPESFTEAWCQHKSEDGSKVIADIVVQWEQSGKTAQGYTFHDQGVRLDRGTLHRTILLNEVRYFSAANIELVIHKVAKSGSNNRYIGYYFDHQRIGYQKIPVECRLGGQFDPVAPKLSYPQSSMTFEVGRPIEGFSPILSRPAESFRVEPELPDGLSFSNDTGSISGTPLRPKPRTLHKVTMQFKFGEVTGLLSIGTGRRIQVTSTDTSAPTDSGEADCLAGGDCPLRAALNVANNSPDSPVIIDLPSGQYSLNGQELVLEGDAVLSGPSSDPAVLDGQGRSRILQLTPGAFVEMNHLHLVNGSSDVSGGALRAEDASVILKNTVFKNNVVTGIEGQGGAVYVRGGKSFEVYDSKFLSNGLTRAGINPFGGAVYAIYSEKITIQRSEFRDNSSMMAGGLYIHSVGSSSPVVLHDNLFVNNRAQHDGGAVQIRGGHVYLSSSTFEGNRAGFFGGAIMVDNTWTMKITDSLFTGNDARGGSAFYSFLTHRDSLNSIERTRFIGNQFTYNTGYGTDGQGIVVYIYQGNYILKDSVFRDNPKQENCRTLFITDALLGLTSHGGNTFDDRTCPLTEADKVL